MTYLLDTSVLIDLLRNKSDTWEFIENHKKDSFVTSCICEAEIMVGIYRESEPGFKKHLEEKQGLFATFSQIIIFDSEQAGYAGEIRADLEERGEMIDDLDILIAAAAKSANAVLVTGNKKHFQKIMGLQVEDVK